MAGSLTLISRNIAKGVLLAAILLLAAKVADAQYYTLGPDPASTRWSRIKGEHFDVIYPSESDSLARRYLYLFEAYRDRNMSSTHIESDHVPIVLHPYYVNSNASVAWAPKRVDVFSTPEFQPLYSQNWDKQLAIHEGRHVVQMAHYLRGFYKILYYLAGEQAIAVGIGINPTGSLFEGDAVMTETEFSPSGRGRSGDFLMYYRASFHEKDFRKEPDWRFVSYNRYTPGKYNYGYMVTSMARYQSGNYYTAGDIMQQQCWWFWRIFDSSHWAYRYASGLTQKQNWYKAAEDMSKWWEEDYIKRAPYNFTDTLLAKRDHRHYLEYKSVLPLPANEGALATRAGKRQSRHLIKIDSTGEEHRLRPFASNTSRMVTTGNGEYYFSELVPDIRWDLRSYSVIRKYNAETNTISNITSRTRFYNPTFTQDGKTIVAVENKPATGSNTNIVFIDPETGEVKRRISGPSGWQLSEAVEYQGDIYTLAVIEDGAGIYRYTKEGDWQEIIAPQSSGLRDLSVAPDGNLVVVSDLNGVNNVYAVEMPQQAGLDANLLQLTSARFGVEDPTFVGDTLYYSDFDKRGYNAVATPKDSLFYRPADFADKYVDRIADSMARQSAHMAPKWTAEQDEKLKAQIDSLPSRHYSKLLHGFHLHSWAPVYADIDKIKALSLEDITTLAAPGALLVFQNNLGTMSSFLGYSYSNGQHAGHAKVTYSGLYPVFELGFDLNNRKQTNTYITETYPLSPSNRMPVAYKRDTTGKASIDFSARAYIPFNLSRGGWNIGLVPDIEYSISNDKVSVYGDKLRYRQTALLNLRYYQLLSQPTARLTPLWGWGLSFNYAQSRGDHDNLGRLFYSNVYAYFPGFNEVQGFKFSWSWQKQLSDFPYAYIDNMVSPARGYDESILTDFHKFSLDYAIPVYGAVDGFATFFFYMQRLIFIPFVDVAINSSPYAVNSNGEYMALGKPLQYSYGTKFLVDLHLFRFGFGIKLGVQYARTGEGRNSFKFVMSAGL